MPTQLLPQAQERQKKATLWHAAEDTDELLTAAAKTLAARVNRLSPASAMTVIYEIGRAMIRADAEREKRAARRRISQKV